MRTIIGILSLPGWLLYIGQLVSVVNFPLAQRLGLQESADSADPMLRPMEFRAAAWDLLWLWTMPSAGILMLAGHEWWPYAAMIGGGAWVDVGGREGAKILGLRKHGVRTGSQGEHNLAMGVYVYFIVVGLLGIGLGLAEVT